VTYQASNEEVFSGREKAGSETGRKTFQGPKRKNRSCQGSNLEGEENLNKTVEKGKEVERVAGCDVDEIHGDQKERNQYKERKGEGKEYYKNGGACKGAFMTTSEEETQQGGGKGENAGVKSKTRFARIQRREKNTFSSGGEAGDSDRFFITVGSRNHQTQRRAGQL